MGKSVSGDSGYVMNGLQAYSTTALYGVVAQLPVKMRAKPTVTTVGTIKFANKSGADVYAPTSFPVNATNIDYIATGGCSFGSAYFTQGGFAVCYTVADGTNYLKVDAEL
jgi:hypothetical protein